MPYVNVKITSEGATPDQKRRIIAGVTDLLVDVLDKDPATTFVVIDEVDLEDWGIGGLPADEYRRTHRDEADGEVRVRSSGPGERTRGRTPC